MKLSALGIALVLGLGCAHGTPPSAAPQAKTATVNVGSTAPDGPLAQASGAKIALNDVLRAHAQNVVVFYRGFYWHSCVRWLGELAKHADELKPRDVGFVAIAADSVEDMASLQAKLPAVKLLTDPDYKVCDAWGLHVAGAESPSPATYVIDRDGKIQWRHLGDETSDWPTYPEVAAALH